MENNNIYDSKISRDLPLKKEEVKENNFNDSMANQEIEKTNDDIQTVSYSSLSETKIVNINDFIFRQNLEFYPNLHGLVVKNNRLKYEENGQVLVDEILTFDLRTLPGDAWLVSPKEFIQIIKTNKNCTHLNDFMNLLNGNAFDHIIMNNDKLENDITNYMSLYFSIKESFHILNENNKILLSNIDNLIASLPKDTLIGKLVNSKLDAYLEMTKTLGDEKGKTMALVLKNKNLPSLIEEEPVKLQRAGYINIAILIYGILNIGIILAIALMK